MLTGVATVGRPKKITGANEQTVRISGAAYKVLAKLAGMRVMKLGDCASDLIVRHGEKEIRDEARKLLKPEN